MAGTTGSGTGGMVGMPAGDGPPGGPAADPAVRPARDSDAEDVHRLSAEIQAYHAAARPELFRPEGNDTLEEIRDRMARLDHFYWVAVQDGAVVGYAYARADEQPASRHRRAQRVLELRQMGVTARSRRSGVGRSLWAAVRGAAEALGVDRVVLNVWGFNRPARAFYESLGFGPFRMQMALEMARHADPADLRAAREAPGGE